MKNPDVHQGSINADTAFVLPKNYGCGLRWEQDKLWGVIEPDQEARQIWNHLQTVLANNGYDLDVVYDDPAFPTAGKYPQVIYWNQTG